MIKQISLTIISLLLVLAVFYRFWFLRQPERAIPAVEDVLISPANGRIAAVERWNAKALQWEKDFGAVQVMTSNIDTAGWLIAIEMNVMNVHYQRAPASGRFLEGNYVPGRFNNALVKTNRFGLRLENERNDLLFELQNGMRYKVVQVAGLLARRIEDYVDPGQEVSAGEVIGLIKMGSQVGLVLPSGISPQVEVGEVVTDGETILARVN
jgi:phosphatidylserine decarboxylase